MIKLIICAKMIQKVMIHGILYITQKNTLKCSILSQNILKIGDIHFIDDFKDLVDKDTCCIPQEYSTKYEILTNVETSGTIKHLLDQYDLNDVRPEPMYNVLQRDDPSHKKEYFIHPMLF